MTLKEIAHEFFMVVLAVPLLHFMFVIGLFILLTPDEPLQTRYDAWAMLEISLPSLILFYIIDFWIKKKYPKPELKYCDCCDHCKD